MPSARNSMMRLEIFSLFHCGGGKENKRCHLMHDKIEKQEKDQKLAEMNLNKEPNWCPLFGHAGRQIVDVNGSLYYRVLPTSGICL